MSTHAPLATAIRLNDRPALREARPVVDQPFASHASVALGAIGALLLLGTLLDLGVLWILQYQPGLQWEFMAVTATVDAYPRLLLAVALLYAALYAGRSASLASYRVLGTATLLLGLGAALFALMIGTNYFALLATVTPKALAVFKGASIKAVALSLIYFIVLIPVGVLGLRRPRPR